MLDRKSIRDQWRALLEDEIVKDPTFTFIDSEEKGPRPAKPYFALKVSSGPAQQNSGNDYIEYDGGTDKFSVTGMRIFILSIQGYASEVDKDKANDTLTLIHTVLDDPIIVEKLRLGTFDLAVTDRGEVTDITTLLDTSFEERSLLEITFAAVDTRESELESIEKVKINGTIDTGDGDTFETGDIIIDEP